MQLDQARAENGAQRAELDARDRAAQHAQDKLGAFLGVMVAQRLFAGGGGGAYTVGGEAPRCQDDRLPRVATRRQHHPPRFERALRAFVARCAVVFQDDRLPRVARRGASHHPPPFERAPRATDARRL